MLDSLGTHVFALGVCVLSGALSMTAHAQQSVATDEPEAPEAAAPDAPAPAASVIETPAATQAPVVAPQPGKPASQEGDSLPGDTSAQAQSNFTEVGVLTSAQLAQRIAELESERDAINLTRPRAGAAMSSILVPGGALAAASGAVLADFETNLCIGEPAPCGSASAGATAVIVVGVFSVLGGLIGTMLTSMKLKKRKQERRRIDLEIGRLQRAVVPTVSNGQ